MSFTSRQAQILFLLINREKPIAQKALLENLQVSRRTLFRELRGINDELKKYHLVLNTRAREGLCIEGTATDKAVAKQVIDQLQSNAPKNREERHQQLLKLLIVNPEIQKIFFYADQLLVSNATRSLFFDGGRRHPQKRYQLNKPFHVSSISIKLTVLCFRCTELTVTTDRKSVV